MGPGTKWPGPACQLHHLLAVLNIFHLLLQFTLYHSPLCSVDYSENYSNRHPCPPLPVKFRQRGAPAENTGIEKKRSLLPPRPPWWITLCSPKGHTSSRGASSYLCLPLWALVTTPSSQCFRPSGGHSSRVVHFRVLHHRLSLSLNSAFTFVLGLIF